MECEKWGLGRIDIQDSHRVDESRNSRGDAGGCGAPRARRRPNLPRMLFILGSGTLNASRWTLMPIGAIDVHERLGCELDTTHPESSSPNINSKWSTHQATSCKTSRYSPWRARPTRTDTGAPSADTAARVKAQRRHPRAGRSLSACVTSLARGKSREHGNLFRLWSGICDIAQQALVSFASRIS